MWQSKAQRDYYNNLKEELLQACQTAGIDVPAAIPIPGLPSSMQAMMIPSPLLTNYPATIALAEVQYNLS